MQQVAEHLTVKVFVYGTLKRDNSREGVLSHDAVRWVDAAILGFDIHDLGSFPCITPSENGGQVFGELVECSNPIDIIKRLDSIEGFHPGRPAEDCLYLREKVDVIELGTGKKVKAFAYVWANPDRLRNKPKIESGKWVRRGGW